MPPGLDTFLGSSAFRGPSLVDRSRDVAAGEATFDGAISAFTRPRDEVAALLPEELELLWNATAPDCHPVIVAFGEQLEGGTVFAGVRVPMGVRYAEAALAVPFVRKRGARYAHMFVARMFTNHLPAQWSGNRFYGYAKRLVAAEWDGTRFTASERDGRPILLASVEGRGAWTRPLPGGSRGLDEIREMSGLPIVGRTDTGRFAGSWFDWDFADARTRPARVGVTWLTQPAPGVAPGSWGAAPGGCYEVSGMRWRVSWPGPFRA